MANFGKLIKEQITRISTRQARAAVLPLRKPAATVKKTVADLKKSLALLEKTLSDLQSKLSKSEALTPVLAETDQKARITAKGMRSLRKKLGLTGAEFGKLLGVSMMTVYQWEKKEGALRVREATRKAILGVRGLGAREAKERLAGLVTVKAKGKKGKGKKAGRKARK